MDDIVAQLILQAFLIGLNAFFAMTEIAVISLSPIKLQELSKKGDKKSLRIVKLAKEPAGFLSTIQIGITLAGFLGSAFAADGFSEYLVNWIYEDLGIRDISPETLDTFSVIIITLILSYFTLVFGELVPKRIAMLKPYPVVRLTAGVVSNLAVVMRPVVIFLSFSTNLVLRLFRMKTKEEAEQVTEEEIRMMVHLGEENGNIEREEKEWIENVFDFGDAKAWDVMTHVSEVKAVSIHQTSEEIHELIRSSGLSRYPVYGKDMEDIRGVLYARDFLLNESGRGKKSLQELYRQAYFVPETLRASVLFREMQKEKIHLAIVVNEYGETCGIITMEDLLEEIVGNIYDEYDPPEHPAIVQIRENCWKIAGNAKVEEVAEELEMILPEDTDYDTFGGLIIGTLHTIPTEGKELTVDLYGYHITVEKMKGRRILETKVERIT